jgi:hypothetical protein
MPVKENLQVKLSPRLREILDEHAQARGIRASELVRWLIIEHCESNLDATKHLRSSN